MGKEEGAAGISGLVLAKLGVLCLRSITSLITLAMMILISGQTKTLIMNTVNEISLTYKPTFLFDNVKISSSDTAYRILKNIWPDDLNLSESFYCLHLNNANKVVNVHLVSKGGITGTPADQRLIFGTALKAAATAIILAHNHPSGTLRPSVSDDRITQKFKEIGELMLIKVVDHIIITEDGYFSYADEGEL